MLKHNPRRFVILPIEYPEIWGMYKKAEGIVPHFMPMHCILTTHSVLLDCRGGGPIQGPGTLGCTEARGAVLPQARAGFLCRQRWHCQRELGLRADKSRSTHASHINFWISSYHEIIDHHYRLFAGRALHGRGAGHGGPLLLWLPDHDGGSKFLLVLTFTTSCLSRMSTLRCTAD